MSQCAYTSAVRRITKGQTSLIETETVLSRCLVRLDSSLEVKERRLFPGVGSSDHHGSSGNQHSHWNTFQPAIHSHPFGLDQILPMPQKDWATGGDIRFGRST